jgi:hypothetical protein
VESTLHNPESDWDATTVAVPLGVKVGSPLGIVSSVEAEIVAVEEAMLLTGILGLSLQASRVLSHTRMCNHNRRDDKDGVKSALTS